MFNMSLVTSTIQAHVTPNFLKHLLKLSLSQNVKKPLNPEFRIKASLAKSQHPKTSTIRDMAFPTHYTPTYGPIEHLLNHIPGLYKQCK